MRALLLGLAYESPRPLRADGACANSASRPRGLTAKLRSKRCQPRALPRRESAPALSLPTGGGARVFSNKAAVGSRAARYLAASSMFQNADVPNGVGSMTHSLMELELYTVRLGTATTPGFSAQKCIRSK